MAFHRWATGVAGILTFSFFMNQPALGWDQSYCQKVLFTGNEYKFKAKSIEEMISIIESTDIDHLNGKQVRSPWEMGMLPNLAARRLGYQNQLKFIASWTVESSINKTFVHAKALAITQGVLNGEASYLSRLPIIDDQLALLKSQTVSDRSEIAEVDAMTRYAFCAYYQPLSANQCYEALDRILTAMAPIQNITSRDEIYEVLTDLSYQKPLTRLALEYISIIESGKKIGSRRLDEDLNRVLGSKDQAWKVLAVLAARGSNFFKLYGYASRKTYPTIAALGVIASAALVFDFSNDQKFSFPRGVKVSCDSGKSYHFWLAAYLARQYQSKWAAYLSSVAYQMKSKTEFRDPNRSFSLPSDSISNEKIRLDLTYAAAGAEFGSSSSSRPKIDIDRKLDLLEYYAEKIEPLSKEDAKDYWESAPARAFYRWNRIFHPERAMSK